MNKREFLKRTALTAGNLVLLTTVFGEEQPTFAKATVGQQEKPPALRPDLVKEFVTVGHRDLQKVKDMLAETPSLLNASWDWGGGDFESALEGAGHMGDRGIAEYLLSKGARMNVFAAAMLGRLDIVKDTLTAFPDLRTSKGP